MIVIGTPRNEPDLVRQGEGASWAAERRVPAGSGVVPVFLALGSMALAIGGTAVVFHPGDSPAGTITPGQGVLATLIWTVIAAINISYAQRT